MKTIVAGSRDITDPDTIREAIVNSGIEVTEVVCGCARGVDYLGRDWAKGNSIRVTLFPADWSNYGKSAGYRRNVDMADYADALVAVWDGKSRGTKHMIDIADAKGLRIYVHRIS